MRALAAVLSLLAGCDFVDHVDRVTVDGGPPGSGDAGGGDGGGEACASWQLVSAGATSLALMDEPPVESTRSARVAVTSELGECEERAMPAVEIDADTLTATIRLHAWRQVEGDCAGGAGSITRPVPMLLAAEGTWTIAAEGAEPLSVKVEPGPGGQCGTGGAECRRDCDCDPGQLCLRSVGIGGAHNSCAVACEVDRDCGGAGVCTDVTDGLARVCALGDECNQQGDRPCPDGYSCDLDSDTCTPSFTLDQESRGPCACDADCEAALRCVRSRPEEEGRCQVACPTGGPWCEGAHVCGRAAEDASGLATTDSVCVWLGE